MNNKDISHLVGVIFIYLAVFGFDYYIINTFKIKGAVSLVYYTVLLLIGFYFVFSNRFYNYISDDK